MEDFMANVVIGKFCEKLIAPGSFERTTQGELGACAWIHTILSCANKKLDKF